MSDRFTDYNYDHRCPWCDATLNGAVKAAGEPGAPGDGDVGVCFECGHPFLFAPDAEGRTRRMTDEEWATMSQDTNVINAVLAVRKVKGQVTPDA